MCGREGREKEVEKRWVWKKHYPVVKLGGERLAWLAGVFACAYCVCSVWLCTLKKISCHLIVLNIQYINLRQIVSPYSSENKTFSYYTF